MPSKLKEPKDLKIKVVSEMEALWSQVIKESESLIKQSEQNILVQRMVGNGAREQLNKIKKKNI